MKSATRRTTGKSSIDLIEEAWKFCVPQAQLRTPFIMLEQSRSSLPAFISGPR
jgi:hypothetical protein